MSFATASYSTCEAGFCLDPNSKRPIFQQFLIIHVLQHLCVGSAGLMFC